eukprot:TRINITY_DN2424_c0_g1_i6.p1 TRINITY_DN2424_c0_g1~~TRINITY_DN2424_c0_g1_i6.p1  ORF type:complete len:999 (-),score=210.45 TRINITY_DN2424_c0_g1_i6:37-3033(-)
MDAGEEVNHLDVLYDSPWCCDHYSLLQVRVPCVVCLYLQAAPIQGDVGRVDADTLTHTRPCGDQGIAEQIQSWKVDVTTSSYCVVGTCYTQGKVYDPDPICSSAFHMPLPFLRAIMFGVIYLALCVAGTNYTIGRCRDIHFPGLYLLSNTLVTTGTSVRQCIGIYSANVTLDGGGMQIKANNAGNPNLQKGIVVAAPGAIIQNVQVVDFLTGIHIGAEGTGCTVQSVSILARRDSCPSPSLDGIVVEGSDEHIIQDNTITIDYSPALALNATTLIGISISRSHNNTVLNNTIEGLYAPSVAFISPSFNTGASVYGMYFEGLRDSHVIGNRLLSLQGGPGGNSTVPGQAGGSGGPAVGIYLTDQSVANEIYGNVMVGLRGGWPGVSLSGYNGTDGAAIGIRTDPSSFDNRLHGNISFSSLEGMNIFEGADMVYVYGQPSVMVNNVTVTHTSRYSTGDRIAPFLLADYVDGASFSAGAVFLNVPNVTLYDMAIAGVRGTNVLSGCATTGVVLDNVTMLEMNHMQISNISGGDGGPGVFGSLPGPGCAAYGVFVWGVIGRGSNNTIHGVVGGDGGASADTSAGGQGGQAAAIYVLSSNLTITNTILGAAGGNGGDGGLSGRGGSGGDAYGLALSSSSVVLLQGTSLAQPLTGGKGGRGVVAGADSNSTSWLKSLEGDTTLSIDLRIVPSISSYGRQLAFQVAGALPGDLVAFSPCVSCLDDSTVRYTVGASRAITMSSFLKPGRYYIYWSPSPSIPLALQSSASLTITNTSRFLGDLEPVPIIVNLPINETVQATVESTDGIVLAQLVFPAGTVNSTNASAVVQAPPKAMVEDTGANTFGYGWRNQVLSSTLQMKLIGDVPQRDANGWQRLLQEVVLNFTVQTDANTDRQYCLGYIDEATSTWRCQDSDLLFFNDSMQGVTNHFTTFAIIVSPDSPKLRTGMGGGVPAPFPYGILFGVLGAALAVVVIIAVAFKLWWRRDIYQSKKMESWEEISMPPEILS